MKLSATITSERGKPVSKTANEYIEVYITNSYKPYAKLSIDASDGDIELANGKGDVIYKANAVEFSRD